MKPVSTACSPDAVVTVTVLVCPPTLSARSNSVISCFSDRSHAHARPEMPLPMTATFILVTPGRWTPLYIRRNPRLGCAPLTTTLAQQRFQRGPDGVEQRRLRGLRRMDLIVLEHGRLVVDAAEEERDERRFDLVGGVVERLL